MKQLFILAIFIFGTLSLAAQPKLISGIWEGSLYLRGQEYHIEFNLIVKRNGKVSGFSNVFLKNGKTVKMKVTGKLYLDRSMNIYEKEILNQELLEEGEWYKRNYQVSLMRDAWGMELTGYWQEQKKELADEKTKLGKVLLTKKQKSKA